MPNGEIISRANVGKAVSPEGMSAVRFGCHQTPRRTRRICQGSLQSIRACPCSLRPRSTFEPLSTRPRRVSRAAQPVLRQFSDYAVTCLSHSEKLLAVTLGNSEMIEVYKAGLPPIRSLNGPRRTLSEQRLSPWRLPHRNARPTTRVQPLQPC